MTGATHACELRLEWQDAVASHSSSLYFHGRSTGEIARILGVPATGPFDATELRIASWQSSLLQTLPRAAFLAQPNRWVTITPNVGRYYPARLIDANTGEATLVRIVTLDRKSLVVDTNHPLSGPLSSFGISAELNDIAPLGAHHEFKEPAPKDKLTRWLTSGVGAQSHRDDPQPDWCHGESLKREDETDDSLFYAQPRFVQHIDGHCRAALAEAYSGAAVADARILDLMSSWVTHLPADQSFARLSGVGLNQAELAANPRLVDYVCQDLNRTPVLPFPARSFDLAVCSVSVEYLGDPVSVFAQVAEVLVDGGKFLNGFSERCFPTKVVSIWSDMHAFERPRWVMDLYRASGCFSGLETHTRHGAPRPPDDEHAAAMPDGDAVFVVSGRKDSPTPTGGSNR